MALAFPRTRAGIAFAVAFVSLGAMSALGAAACRPNDPVEPRTLPNSPLPRIDKPQDPPAAPSPKLPRSERDGGAQMLSPARGSVTSFREERERWGNAPRP